MWLEDLLLGQTGFLPYLKFTLHHPVQMANQVALWCIEHERSSCSEILRVILETLFDLAHSYQIYLLTQYLLDQQNMWVDPLSLFSEPSVEWCLYRLIYHSLTSRFSCLNTNLFAALNSHISPLRDQVRSDGGKMSRDVRSRLEQVSLHLPVPSSNCFTASGVASPSFVLWESAAYCSLV